MHETIKSECQVMSFYALAHLFHHKNKVCICTFKPFSLFVFECILMLRLIQTNKHHVHITKSQLLFTSKQFLFCFFYSIFC